ncbi:hypothetical protein A3A21_01955 [Candidatus Jorgensenbacteria bacterium RIFCSPLOWO2_01_FULL_45_25b]|uniref:Uncharacterized protein n=1 Tax=Candidatus Jorgensenbacteria bacterium RIFCSPLOWO2_01_FULL_45_25b TaxID=1798471 RepID=A0A1F6BYZ3_9BACT|nr:MAG: hypothetical protein A3A21_01955 [Candidatus Jorgensenbacteria bacterium RIFCSPLOWO2_01_FULL_45_25b]
MTKKATKIRKNSAHTFTVVLENINSKLDLVLDGHQVLDKKITDLHEEVGEFKAEVSYKFDVVIDELHIIRNELKEKVGRDEFVLLEKRVRVLEKTQSR